MKSKSGLWREVLYAIRRVVKDGLDVTSATLSEETDLNVKTCSAWLAILAKYGYVRRTGREPANKRWHYVWELTKFGVEYKQGKKRQKQAKPTLRIAANPPRNQG